MRYVLLAVAPLLLLLACDPGAPPNDGPTEEDTAEAPEFREDGTLTFYRDSMEPLDIAIEIADTDEARARGLMGREALPEMSGMLFIFEEEAERSFWMADTPLSLDLLFIDADGVIGHIHKYARPFSSEQIPSEGPAQYVLEVPAGFTDQHNIAVTDSLSYERL